MRNWIVASLLVLLPAVAIAADAPPDWAFLPATPGYQPPPDKGQPRHVAGSTKAYTLKQVDDWLSEDGPGRSNGPNSRFRKECQFSSARPHHGVIMPPLDGSPRSKCQVRRS